VVVCDKLMRALLSRSQYGINEYRFEGTEISIVHWYSVPSLQRRIPELAFCLAVVFR
jgi:hypothetical protein